MTRSADARALVREAGGDELVERLDHLDAVRRARHLDTAPAPIAPDRGAHTDYDVVIAGGGLWLVLAPVLAARGLRVAVFERARSGAAHREWNASGAELSPLVDGGILSEDELARLVVARYEAAFCRFRGGAAYPVRGVLDCAVDARALLGHVRRIAEARGVAVFDGHTVAAHSSGPDAVAVRVVSAGASRDVTAKLLVDARGAASPHASADLVCPTVGGVMRGLAEGKGADEVDPAAGEILVTVDGAIEGRQHVWECFPGRPGEATVYLFYYARAAEPSSLADLYARFFRALALYKRGEPRLVRPTFGYIPGWSRLSAAPAPPDPRIVLVGDAAARHSPLTYCGFGAALRSFLPAADAIARALDGAATRRCVIEDAPIHGLTGALAQMMASRVFQGEELNQLLDAAFATLHAMGGKHYANLIQDEMEASAFAEFLRRTAVRHPAVWPKVVRGLGLGGAGRWGYRLARALVS